MADKNFEEREEAKKRAIQQLIERDRREAEGARLRQKEDEQIEKENEEMRKKLAAGAKFEPPKRKVIPASEQELKPKQEQVFESIKKAFDFDDLRKKLFGN